MYLISPQVIRALGFKTGCLGLLGYTLAFLSPFNALLALNFFLNLLSCHSRKLRHDHWELRLKIFGVFRFQITQKVTEVLELGKLCDHDVTVHGSVYRKQEVSSGAGVTQCSTGEKPL